MSTDLISNSYSGTTTSLSSLLGTSSTSSTESSATDSLASGLSIKGDGGDFSKGAKAMQQLKDLASSDPDKFKEVTQQISDKLSEAADGASDSNTAKMLSSMAEKFASASSSGSMDSLTPPQPPTGGGGPQGQAAQHYARQNGDNPMATMDSIVSSALSGVGSAEA